ncbi:HNH endonuclease [cyanobacterium TDX16]|nr:HNH endonuclease [cyanobacterium TDX16]
MRYWWVNQNQTFAAEVQGGYIWSPKRKANKARNQFYENMREVSPGDRVFSFRDTLISAVSIASSHCYESPKPAEFGTAGRNWANLGWKVDVVYKIVEKPLRPKDHIESIRPLLPAKYSPLHESGDGLQSVYLAEISQELADHLLGLLQEQNSELDLEGLRAIAIGRASRRDADLEMIDAAIEKSLLEQPIEKTEKDQLVKARRGQGRFRANVAKFEKHCRITKVADSSYLIASHIKPWRSCENYERLDGENGLLLAPTIDFLFHRGYISFADSGALILSPVAVAETLVALGVPVDGTITTGSFTDGQSGYLAYHRREVFLQAERAD